MADVRLSLLGAPLLEVGGGPVELERRKTVALLSYLAASGKGQSRETLAALLWPEADESRARSGLRRELSILNKALGEGRLEIERDTIRLNPGPELWVDVRQFEAELAACRTHGHATDAVCPDCLPHLQEAVSLYRGDFMAGFTLRDSSVFDEWQHFQTESLRRDLTEALERLVRGQGMQADFQAAIPYARRWVALDPLHEPTHRQLMELYARAGQRAAALHQYQECVRLLQEELGVPPAVETTALAERIRLETGGQHGRLLKSYELRELIGAGGFGEVYHAYQPLVQREVAIKVILPQYANQPDFIRRFEAEAQLVAQLEHPHIVPLYDFWREPDGAYLVMRWLRGGSLEESLKKGRWQPKATAHLLEQLTGALMLAHQRGIVHRDIKPANILLDELGNGYLSDFGIAKNLASTTQTQPDLVVGSPAYLAPELINGESVTARADIYSLGVMLYQLLTGQHPFADTTPPRMIFRHLAEPLPSLQALRPELPAALDEVIQQATAKEPAERFADVAALAAAVRRALALDGAPAGPADVSTPLLAPNPYKGLRAFQQGDAADFFGRAEFVERLVTRLADSAADPAARFLAVVGPSGSGKSSVVKAGLIPALRAGALPGSSGWYIVELTPGPRPLEELETAFLRIAINPPPTLLEQLRADERGLLRAVNRILPDDESELLLVIDQFEELFTLVEAETERSHVLESLWMAITDPRSRLRVVITLRADFYDQPLLYPTFGQLLSRRMETILPLSGEELAQAITGPAERVGSSLEPGLAALMAAEVQSQPGMLPLLQYALTELFERRQGRRLTHEAYQTSGGVVGALAQRADALYSELDGAGQAAIRRLFLRLVILGEGTADTRRRVPRPELLSLGHSQVNDGGWNIESIIDTFGQYRLLTFDRDPATRNPTVEVAHEALLSEWGRLRQWLAEDREYLLWQQRLRAALHQWQTSGQDEGALLRGAPLVEAENWFIQRRDELSQTEQTFIQAGLALRDRRAAEQEAQRQRELEAAQKLAEAEHFRAEEQSRAAANLRQRAVWLVGALVIAGLLAVVAVIFGRQAGQNAQAALAEADQRATAQAIAETEQAEAERQARIATARELAAAAVANLEVDPERSILLALQAVSTTLEPDGIVMPEAESVLHRAIMTSRVARTFIGHTDGIYGLDLSPDGSRLVTASDDGTAKIWDTATGQELFSLDGRNQWVNDAVFSPDGTLVATGGEDHMVRLWDVATGQELQVLAGHKGRVMSVAFSPDGQLLASGGFELLLFDLTTGQPVGNFDDEIRRVAFSPDGTKLVTGDYDGLVQVWDAPTGRLLLDLPGHEDAMDGLSFSPDGRLLASTGRDGLVKVWDIEILLSSDTRTGSELYTIRGHNSQVRDVAFSPDGMQLASASWDGTVILWDAATGGEILTLVGHAAGPTAVDFSPDGMWLATASADSTARLWRLTPPAELLSVPDVLASGQFAISPDGSVIVAGHRDGTLRAWNIETGQELPAPAGHPEWVNNSSFSPDGTRLATASDDFTAKVWDVATNWELLTLAGHTDLVWDVAFNPDGTRLATASGDKTVRVWDAETGQELLALTDFAETVGRVGFSPDGTRLAAASGDSLIKFFDPTTGEKLMELDHGGVNIWGLAFSEDGSRLVSGGLDAVVKIWDANSGAELIALTGHTSLISSIAFSPDGRRLATGSADTTVKLWDAATGREELTLDNGDFEVFLVHFSADGKHLVVGAEDGLRVYTLDVSELIDLAHSRLTRSLTIEECRQYLHVEACPK